MYEKQMELFEDGGLRDEGGMVDEESGNDVPIGSTRKEVRDDIPAMLSEGEFVFPADVVRYIGLENLMRIRQDAKQGLKQMDAMGQMGNSDEATMPDDLPFGMMDLVIIEGEEEPEVEKKAHGGVVHMNEGGLTTPSFVVPKFNPRNQDVRQYENADGKKLNIPFLGGRPVYPIPEGYFLAGQAPVETETETEQAIPVSDDSDPPPPPPEGYDWKTDTSGTDGKALQEWIDNASKTSTVGNVVTAIISAMNPVIGGFMALGLKKEKKTIVEMLDEKIAQAKKTPIPGQVEALEKMKTRLTTKEGKGIISTVVGGIVDTVSDALGFGEEEKVKVKAVAGTVAGQDPNESDTATKEAVAKSLRPTPRPDGLKTTAENFRETEANLFDDRSNSIVEAGDDAAMQQMLAAKDEDIVMGQPIDSNLQLPDVGLASFESGDALQTRAALGFSDPTDVLSKLDPENKTFESFTPADAEELKGKLTTDNAPATVTSATVTSAKEDLRKTMADLTYDTTRAMALSSLSDFDEDASSQAIKSYLKKAIDNVDTIVKGPDTSTNIPAEPVQGGGDDDDGPSFPTVTQEQISQAQEQATNSAIESGATQEEAEKAGTVAGGQMAGKGYVGGYGFNKGGLASRKKKKK